MDPTETVQNIRARAKEIAAEDHHARLVWTLKMIHILGMSATWDETKR